MIDGKRSLQVNVRVSPHSLKLLRQAAEMIWPGLVLSNSTLLLTLAQNKAKEILDGNPHVSKLRGGNGSSASRR